MCRRLRGDYRGARLGVDELRLRDFRGPVARVRLGGRVHGLSGRCEGNLQGREAGRQVASVCRERGQTLPCVSSATAHSEKQDPSTGTEYEERHENGGGHRPTVAAAASGDTLGSKLSPSADNAHIVHVVRSVADAIVHATRDTWARMVDGDVVLAEVMHAEEGLERA